MKVSGLWIGLSWVGLVALGVSACGTDSPITAVEIPDVVNEVDADPSRDVWSAPDVISAPDVVSQPDASPVDITESPDIANAPDTIAPADTTEPPDTEVSPDVTGDPDANSEPDAGIHPTLADLVAAFHAKTNGYQTSPNRVFDNLVVTVLKPDMGTELGGFFALDPSDLTGIYFAPTAGAADLPAGLSPGSIIQVEIARITQLQGMITVTEYSDLHITGAVDDLDVYLRDASEWTLGEWKQSQAAFIELVGMISGESAPAGGDGAWRKFSFLSEGVPSEAPTAQVRLPASTIRYLGIEDSCFFLFSGGAVWTYQGPLSTDVLQYQAMFADQDELVLLCDPPRLVEARATDPTTVTLAFSRPMDELSLTPSAFVFSPPLQVLDVALSSDLKTLTLTTAEHASEHYTVTVGASVEDTTGERLDAAYNAMDFSAVIPTHLAILYCFEDSAGNFIQTPTVVAQGFSNVTAATRPGGIIKDYAGNGSRKPADCPPGNGKSLSTDATKDGGRWSRDVTFDPASDAYFTFSFEAPAGRVHIQFDVQRSGSGPQHLALWQSVTGQAVAQDVEVAEGFRSYPMLPPAGTSFAFDIPPTRSGPVEVRIYPYGATANTGTFRIDNLTVLYSHTP